MTFEGYVKVRLVSPSRKERVSISRMFRKEDRECKGQMQLMKGMKSPIFGCRKGKETSGRILAVYYVWVLVITRTANLGRLRKWKT